VISPTVWNPKDPAQLPGVMAKIRFPALKPWNESPILRAMLEAKRDLNSATGYKTMIVVTDGMDNRYQHDTVLNPKGLSIPALLRSEFTGSGIAVHVVGFKLPDHEEAETKKQFGTVETLNPPGSFTDTDDAENLALAIRKALQKSIHYWIETPTSVLAPGISRTGAEIGTTGSGARWFTTGLKPGVWKVRILPVPYLVRETVLAPADRLLLELDYGLNGLTLRRAPWAALDFPASPWSAARDWRLSLIQNQRDGPGYRGLISLERQYDPGETVLQLPRPNGIWFDLKPSQPNANPIAIEWHEIRGYPAATWAMSSPAWPESQTGPDRPVLSAWWNPNQEPRIAGRFDQDVDFQKWTELSGKSLPIDGDPVTIESLAVEDHVVATSPTKRERKPCLVVRLKHDPNNPAEVRIRGATFQGQSLWQYVPAGRSTALFWPATDHTLESLSAIEFVSIRALRRLAIQQGYTAKLSGLPAPDPADERPLPPLPLP
jgi:hypothetical protein